MCRIAVFSGGLVTFNSFRYDYPADYVGKHTESGGKKENYRDNPDQNRVYLEVLADPPTYTGNYLI